MLKLDADRSLSQIPSRYADLPEGTRTTLLVAIYESAKAPWVSSFIVPTTEFLPYLIDRVPGSVPLEQSVRQLQVGDLYLACACASRNPAAISRLDQILNAEVERAMARRRWNRLQADDVRQIIRQKLLVAHPGTPPRITEYTGQGSLQAWLRVVAVRTLIDLGRDSAAQKRKVDHELLEQVHLENPEHAYLRKLYQHEFDAAFDSALRSLSARQRNLLRQQLVHSVTLEELAALHRVHRATIARWAAQARQALEDSVREELVKRLRASPSEFESIVRFMKSELALSVRRLLCEPVPDGLSIDASAK